MKYKTEGLNELAKQANDFVNEVGFGTNDFPLRIALIHSEISEALEAYRKDKYSDKELFELSEKKKEFSAMGEKQAFKTRFDTYIKDGLEDEIADSIIRLLDLCGAMQIDIEWHIQQKMKYNKTRGYKFGGKKF